MTKAKKVSCGIRGSERLPSEIFLLYFTFTYRFDYKSYIIVPQRKAICYLPVSFVKIISNLRNTDFFKFIIDIQYTYIKSSTVYTFLYNFSF